MQPNKTKSKNDILWTNT